MQICTPPPTDRRSNQYLSQLRVVHPSRVSPRRNLMSESSSFPDRRTMLAASAFAGAFSLLPTNLIAASTGSATHKEHKMTATGDAIRSFHFEAPQEALVDLKKRVAATRWPDKETVTNASQGVQLATMQKLAQYWATEHDWRKCEAKLSAVPNFITQIDGLDIHFIRVRSKHENALP